jgi:hypothetical protein
MSSPLYRLRQARSALGAAIETLERSRKELETVILDLEAQDVPKPSCKHEHLNMDGICRACGQDCRGIPESPKQERVCSQCGRTVLHELGELAKAKQAATGNDQPTGPVSEASESPNK